MFNTGNVLVTVNQFTGSITAPTFIAEYNALGQFVQNFGQVPTPGGAGVTTDQARDVIASEDGFFLYNGTFDPFLAEYDLATGTYSQETFPGWSTINNLSYGGIARQDGYIYVTDMRTFGAGDTPQGIVRFDLEGGETIRFADDRSGSGFIDLNIGLDGLLYALESSGHVVVYDPATQQELDQIRLDRAVRGIAVDENGLIYGASFNDDSLYQFSAQGEELDSLFVGEALQDLDISRDGRLVAGTAFSASVILSDITLDQFTSFSPVDSGETFVSFIEPELPPTVLGGDRNDNRLVGTNGRDSISGRAGNDTLLGERGDDILLGGGGNDRLRSGSGDDLARGGSGSDFIQGGLGFDQLFGNDGEDTLNGQEGRDRLIAGNGNDHLIGGSDSDLLVGGAGEDILIGVDLSSTTSDFGRGDMDTLRGGRGADLIVLGNQSAVFYDDGDILTSGSSDYAVIQGFNVRQDRLQLKGEVDAYRISTTQNSLGKLDAQLIHRNSDWEQGEQIALFKNVSHTFSLDSLQIQFV